MQSSSIPIPAKVGTEWLLEARLPSGEIVALRGFETEAAARQWLGSARHLAEFRTPISKATFVMRLRLFRSSGRVNGGYAPRARHLGKPRRRLGIRPSVPLNVINFIQTPVG
jgi:hypothetical protein